MRARRADGTHNIPFPQQGSVPEDSPLSANRRAPSSVTPVSELPPTIERILEAAIDAIEEGGEASLRIDAVARAAGISKPAIYYFFDNREGLVAAAQAERFRRSLLTGLAESIELTKAATSREEFEALLPLYINVITEPASAHRRAQRMQVLGSAVSRPMLTSEVVAATERGIELTKELVRIPFDRGWATSGVDPDAIAVWWLGMTHGLHLLDLVADERRLAEWRDITLDQLRRLVFRD